MDRTALPTKASAGYVELFALCVTGQVPEGWTNTSWRDDQACRMVPQISYEKDLRDALLRCRIFGDASGELGFDVSFDDRLTGHSFVLTEGVRPDLLGAVQGIASRVLLYTDHPEMVESAALSGSGALQELGPEVTGPEILDEEGRT